MAARKTNRIWVRIFKKTLRPRNLGSGIRPKRARDWLLNIICEIKFRSVRREEALPPKFLRVVAFDVFNAIRAASDRLSRTPPPPSPGTFLHLARGWPPLTADRNRVRFLPNWTNKTHSVSRPNKQCLNAPR